MKKIILLALILVVSSYVHAQIISSRLRGMGNLSLIVIDPESEVFKNPAKATLLSRPFFHLSPEHVRWSDDSDFSSSLVQNGNPNSEASSSENTFSLTTIPFDAVLNWHNFWVGGAFTYTDKTETYVSTYETKRSILFPDTSIIEYYTDGINNDSRKEQLSPVLFIAYKATEDLSVGLLGSLFNNNETMKSISGPGTADGANRVDAEHEIEQNGIAIQPGLIIGKLQPVQVSLSSNFGKNESAKKIVRLLAYGIPQRLDLWPIVSTKSTNAMYSIELRVQLSRTIMAGIKASRDAIATEVFTEQTWNDPGRTEGVYERRKTVEENATLYETAIGVSWLIEEHKSLVGIEFVYSPISVTTKHFYTSDGTYFDGRQYRIGQTIFKDEYTYRNYTMRIGAELEATEGLKFRVGAQSSFSSYSSSFMFDIDLRKGNSNGTMFHQ